MISRQVQPLPPGPFALSVIDAADSGELTATGGDTIAVTLGNIFPSTLTTVSASLWLMGGNGDL
jgi:hypothetical protein